MHRIEIVRGWDGEPVETDPVLLAVSVADDRLVVELDAPFHGDPPPAGPPGRCDGLWEYEVVELFLVGTDERYLELELGPHGHWLGLVMRPIRERIDEDVSVELDRRVDAAAGRWSARASLALAAVPRPIVRWNAFAIHGTGSARRYLAASPLPGASPDFHRIAEYPPFPADGPLTSA